MSDEYIEVLPISKDVANTEQEAATKWLDIAKGFKIVAPEGYENGSLHIKSVKGLQKALDIERKKITKPLDLAKKAVMDLFRPGQEALEKAESLLKGSMLTYKRAQEDKAREEAKKAAEVAARKEAKIRAKLEEEARIAAEKAEKLRQEGNAAKAAAEEERAAQAALNAQDVHVEAKPVKTEVPKAKGISTRKIWSAEVVDESQVPREYMVPDMAKLNKMAQAFKGEVPVAGVKFSFREVMSGRSV